MTTNEPFIGEVKDSSYHPQRKYIMVAYLVMLGSFSEGNSVSVSLSLSLYGFVFLAVKHPMIHGVRISQIFAYVKDLRMNMYVLHQVPLTAKTLCLTSKL